LALDSMCCLWPFELETLMKVLFGKRSAIHSDCKIGRKNYWMVSTATLPIRFLREIFPAPGFQRLESHKNPPQYNFYIHGIGCVQGTHNTETCTIHLHDTHLSLSTHVLDGNVKLTKDPQPQPSSRTVWPFSSPARSSTCLRAATSAPSMSSSCMPYIKSDDKHEFR
jgi:hypothetical protein